MKRSSVVLFLILAFCLSPYSSWATAHADTMCMWLFDEDKGDKVLDLSGNNNHGIIHGGVKWTGSGKFGGALSFNGSDGWVEVPNTPSLIASKITVVAWVYLDNIIGNHSIVEKYDWKAGKGSFIVRTNGDAIKLGFQRGTTDPSPGVQFAQTKGVLAAKEWIHVAGSLDGDLARLYINGKEVANTNMPDSDGVLPSDASLSLGSRGDTHDTHWYAGLMDEVAIFDEALPDVEIKKIVQRGLKVYTAGVYSKDKLSVTWGDIKSNF